MATGKISVAVGNRIPILQRGLCLITVMSLTYGLNVFLAVPSCNSFFFAVVKLHFIRMKNVGLKSSSNLMLLEANREGHYTFHYAQ
jgi:hypothetical protein